MMTEIQKEQMAREEAEALLNGKINVDNKKTKTLERILN